MYRDDVGGNSRKAINHCMQNSRPTRLNLNLYLLSASTLKGKLCVFSGILSQKICTRILMVAGLGIS